MRALIDNIPGVQGAGRLEEKEPAFLLGNRLVLDAARYNDELPFLDPFVRTIAKLHAEAAFHDKKHLVFVIVMMEDEFSFDFVELHHLAVEFGGDIGLPEFSDFRELLGDVDLHGSWDYLGPGKVAKN